MNLYNGFLFIVKIEPDQVLATFVGDKYQRTGENRTKLIKDQVIFYFKNE